MQSGANYHKRPPHGRVDSAARNNRGRALCARGRNLGDLGHGLRTRRNSTERDREDETGGARSRGRGGRGGYSGRGRGGERRNGDDVPRRMTYGRLKTWSEFEDAGKLALFMSGELPQIETFLLEDTVKEDWFTLFLKAVNHVLSAQHQKEAIKQLLNALCKTRFFDTHLVLYTTDKTMQHWPEAEDFFKSMVNIINETLDKLPNQAGKCLTAASTLLNNITVVMDNSELVASTQAVCKKAKETYQSEKQKESQRGTGKFGRFTDADTPPDDFMDLSVVPTIMDLKEDAKPFVRSAKIEGSYKDTNQYLDIQFRLMRQDFIFPLRQGINNFKKSGCKKDFNCSDLRFYFDVQVLEIILNDGINFILQFDVSKLKKVKWEFSKRLIFGSLLCLSKDNFETCIFATVAQRDEKKLKDGYVTVTIKNNLEDVFNSTLEDTYIMAESAAYFESYCHVLQGLKEMSSNLPLQEYIVKCEKNLKPPRYLLPSGGVRSLPIYDLSCLMQQRGDTEIPVLTTVKWPPAEVMCLNQSQREAAQMALTKELAIIQGPPGTGKTYVGLKVMRVLLENKDVMAGNDENTMDPILLVCYTNHALDQFLEGVLDFCPEGIVRVGGKNTNEKLQKFNIKELRQKVRKGKLFSDMSVRRTVYDCNEQIKLLSGEIKGLNQKMNELGINIQTEAILDNWISDEHLRSLELGGPVSHSKSRRMREWLNASSSAPESLVPKMIEAHFTKLILQWQEMSASIKISENMNIRERANLYNQIVSQYRQHLYQGAVPHMSAHINALIESSYKTILTQEQLQTFFPAPFFYAMQKTVRSGAPKQRRETFEPGQLVKTWLLGLHRSLQEQLDDIQTLTNLMSGEDEAMDFDDAQASKQAEEARILDEDDDDVEFANTLNQSIQTATNNIVSVMKRAEMLGINEDVLAEIDDDNNGHWQTVRHKPMNFKQIQAKLKGIKPMSETEADDVEDVWMLNINQRFALYKYWLGKYKESLAEKMNDCVERYTTFYNKKKECDQEETLFILKSSRVIAMTTTGAAKHRAVLQAIGCRIIVVEEAAEVLESHIVTALNKRCNHLILIGDHQQLRPNPTVYLLAKEFGLEISLFERLIKNKVPHVLLREQHRMRPEIANIMRHIYPDLCDHSSVQKYEHIKGVSKDIFFICHNKKESNVDDNFSKSNLHEANFVVALCKYILHQCYTPDQITILATYAGQVFAIKKRMKEISFAERIRVTAVDNFQGEENDIILLSLVRSNDDSNVGFLKVDNRVCVALSRAKKGLFVIGDLHMLASKSTLWYNIVGTAEQEKIIGEGLPVVCQNHPEFKQVMTCSEDFDKCPEGGCGRPCEYRLTCGHTCARKCHSYDFEHKEYKCHKACPKKCSEGHTCKKKCFQECGDCTEKVAKQIPVCGHEDHVPCHLPASSHVCQQRCEDMLECEHQCPGRCGQCRRNRKHADCKREVEYAWPCGHINKVPCYKKPSAYPCPSKCETVLDCGHSCPGNCSDCLGGSVHMACTEKCEKQLPCGHSCPSSCGIPCMPCRLPCPSQCKHSSCTTPKHTEICGHACPPCREKCKYGCSHSKCTKECSEQCDVQVCEKKCRKDLKCNHQCSGVCGELCVCAQCIGNKIQRIEKPKEGAEADKKKQLLLKIPSCGHVFLVEELDKYVKEFGTKQLQFIVCPKCSKPINKCMRYEKINKLRCSLREEMKLKLRKESRVDRTDVKKLQESQKLLEDSSLLDYFRSMNVDVTNRVELHAVSFQLKCAFVLSEIASLQQEDAKFGPAVSLEPRKNIVRGIKKQLTEQQKRELTIELKHCICLSLLTQLSSMCRMHVVQVPENLSAQVKESLETLKTSKPDVDKVERAQNVGDILGRRIRDWTPEANAKAKCILLEKTAKRAMRVLESGDQEILCDLVQQESLPKRVPFSAASPGAGLVTARSGKLTSSSLKSQKEDLLAMAKAKLLKEKKDVLTGDLKDRLKNARSRMVDENLARLPSKNPADISVSERLLLQKKKMARSSEEELAKSKFRQKLLDRDAETWRSKIYNDADLYDSDSYPSDD